MSNGKHQSAPSATAVRHRTRPVAGEPLLLKPLAQAIALLLVAGSAQAAQPFSAGWFSAKGASTAASSGGAGGVRVPGSPPPLAQQQRLNQQFKASVGNLNNTVAAIAAQQAAQAAGRTLAQVQPQTVPNGLGEGGLKVDENPLTQGWHNAKNPTQTQSGGKTTVTVQQTADKAVLNWETFNVGRDTTLKFDQQSDWAVLNRVNDPNARPSQILGQIVAPGTVLVMNRNGVVFDGSSQVNVRNLVVAATDMSDEQFTQRGLYVDTSGTQATFTNAGGKVVVQRGAQISTHEPASSTSGGGYVLLLGSEVDNQGQIITSKGQTTLAAGDDFYIRRGQGTESNQYSTTRGNEVASSLRAGSTAGSVSNSGLIQAAGGDITLTGHQVRQDGVLLATTSVDRRGTIHLLNSASDSSGSVTLGQGSVTAIMLDASSALDSQRDASREAVDGSSGNLATGKFDNLSKVLDRPEQSRVEIVSGGTVDFQSGSLTLANGGQVAVSAGKRSLVDDGAHIDVSGALGVKVAMENNVIKVNVQGNEQRDASGNRENGGLTSKDVWVDIRDLVHVAAGVNGYATDRWYTAGGLLEVSGYLGTRNHSIGEWMALGGTVTFTGQDVVTRAGSQINLSGGTLAVQDGYINQSWLRGADGRLYEVSKAPGDLLYTGIYQGFEEHSARWGQTNYYYNPLIAPQRRFEQGYTLGRNAGSLVVATTSAVLDGQLVGEVYQSERQTEAPVAGLDGYKQLQNARAQGAQLVIGEQLPGYLKATKDIGFSLKPVMEQVTVQSGARGDSANVNLDDPLDLSRQGQLVLDSDLLASFGLGGLTIAASEQVLVNAALNMADGGEVTLYGPKVQVNADITAHGGQVRMGDVLQMRELDALKDIPLDTPAGTRAQVLVADGVRLDVSGVRSDVRDSAALAWRNGGSVSLRSSGDVLLGAGSVVDVSGGAVRTAVDTIVAGNGGNLTLHSSENNAAGGGRLQLGGELRGYGSALAGTLSLRADQVRIGGVDDDTALHLAEDFFSLGFAQYNVRGGNGLTVAEGSQVQVTRPVQWLDAGQAVGDQAQAWLPPLLQQNAAKGVITQRAGAGLSLAAGDALFAQAAREAAQLVVERGASISVDPLQAISLSSTAQLTLDGTLRAAGGKVSLVQELPVSSATGVSEAPHQRAIRLGSEALIDVSGQAYTAVDARGRRYGRVDAGGSIVIGGSIDHAAGTSDGAYLYVDLAQGSQLRADGAQATLDIPGMGAVRVASNGGSISLASSLGLRLDGSMSAKAGGAGAAGGSLGVALDTGLYQRGTLDDTLMAPRELVLSQHASGNGALEYAKAYLGVDQVEAGGFGNLALLSDGSVAFDGSLELGLAQGLQIYAGSLVLTEGSAGDARVTLRAPYVRLAGSNHISTDSAIRPTIKGGGSQQTSQAQLQVQANLLELRDSLTLGAHGSLALSGGQSLAYDRRGFALTRLRSEGDMRFLAALDETFTTLQGNADIELLAAQLYPATGAKARVMTAQDATLRVGRVGTATPGTPHSVFGSLGLYAGTVEQGGVVRAPLGTVELGSAAGNEQNIVRLLAGSITSVSAKGLLMPYGGTVDGLSYLYGGKAVDLKGAANGEGVKLTGLEVDVQEGALIDLSGGGELTGAGFVSGRGGSTDARYNPLVQLDADGRLVLPSLSSNPVYAIVPGLAVDYAPLAGDAGAANPGVGQQITLDHGIPGLPAGTYTLLPASYALLPGAFRVELNGLAGSGQLSASAAMRNGSWATSGKLSVAHTSISQALPNQFIITSGSVLRRYSQYNEMSYADFVRADAATKGVPRAALEADGKWLGLTLTSNTNANTSFNFAGIADFSAAAGARRGGAWVQGGAEGIEILADGQDSQLQGQAVVSLRDSQLNALGAPSLTIGGRQDVVYGQGGNQITFMGHNRNVWLRSGAELRAAEVLLLSDSTSGGIHVEQGARINTVGQGAAPYDANDGFMITPGARALLAVSNGRLDVLAPIAVDPSFGPGAILIGECASGQCSGQTELYTEGSIFAATNNTFSLDDAVSFGARHLGLAVGRINVGSSQALADAAAAGTLGQGLTFNQQVLDRLFQGVSGNAVPALETLTLTAADSLNFFGDVVLDTYDATTGKNRLEQLVLGVPAIYGSGAASDHALIRTGELVWSGARNLPGSPIAGGAGSGDGVLDLEVERMVFGYGANAQPKGSDDMARLVLGFQQVNIRASQQVSASHKGSLQVYHRRGDYQADGSFSYSGGNLSVDTPLWTGAAGSVNRIKVGGELQVSGGGGKLATGRDGVGAELALSGQRLNIDATLSLPSGKLTLEAIDDLLLGDKTQIDLAGRTLTFNDVLKYSAGGTLVLNSKAGNIHQAAGATVDLRAVNNRAGRLEAIALGEQAGRVELLGQILGSASGRYDAGGTLVSYAKGAVDIRAQQLDDFAALNERLNRDDVTGGRSFQLKQGDLVIGDELKAGEIVVSLDNGHLTVNGTVDASGEQVGSIRLAAKNGLTIGSGALLDAHGSLLRVDSYGAIIDAPNRALIDLNSGEGQLTLQAGARFDLRHGTGATAGHDGRNRGTLQLTAPRVGGDTAGDIAIDASGALDIRGALSIAVVGNQRYSDANDGGKAANGRDYQYIDQAWLDAKHGLNQTFMQNLLANRDLLDNRLKGLNNAGYAEALHLRPGLEVTTAEGVDLVVRGDLDLSGHRYESLNPSTQRVDGVAGSGEVGNLALRSGGNLEVYGSISDGFIAPDLATDANRWDGKGWILLPGKQPFDTTLVIPREGVELAAGTLFPGGSTLNFDLPFSATTLAANTRLPGQMVLASALTLPAGTVLDAAVRDSAGNLLYAAGTLLGSAVTLAAETRLDAGTRLPVAAAVRDGVWASGSELPAGGLSQRGALSLATGAVLPVNTDVKLADGTHYIDLRPEVNGQQGRNWALATMLPEGSQSWSMRLVAGADLAAADSRITRPDEAAGLMRLADQHYTATRVLEVTAPTISYVWSDLVTGSRVPGAPVPAAQVSQCRLRPTWCIATETPGTSKFEVTPQTQLFSVLRTGTGDLELLSAGDWRMDSLYGVYTAGTQSAALLVNGADPYQLAQGRLPDGSVLGSAGGAYESATSGYRAWYPEQGGNLLLAVGGDLTGNLVAPSVNPLATPRQQASAGVGNWLWRQGNADTAAAWWLNFGSYALDPSTSGGQPWLVGFTGIGTLGGGNLNVLVNGAAGLIESASGALSAQVVQRSHGLNLAVASTGRVLADGSVQQTGGGDLLLRVGGGVNTSLQALDSVTGNADLRGTLTNLRGALQVQAGSVGVLDLMYGSYPSNHTGSESRAYDAYVATRGVALGGLTLMPGDSTVRLETRGDLVLQGVGDPGRVVMYNTNAFTGTDGADYLGNGWSWFSLWRANTAVDLLSLGGNLTPIVGTEIAPGRNLPASGGRMFYPTALRAVAANGSLYYGEAATAVLGNSSTFSLMTAPSANTELQLLAGQSIYAGGFTVSQTGTDTSAIATPQRPGYVNYSTDFRKLGNNLHSDLSLSERMTPLFSFALNTYAAAATQPAEPVRFYAVDGDIVGLSTGEVLSYARTGLKLYQGAGPVWIMAGRDIVNAGVPLGAERQGATGIVDATRYGNPSSSGNLIIHGDSNDVSIVSAGRDIRLSTFNVAGPGLLEVTAGRNLLNAGQGVAGAYQEGAINSIGRIGGGGSGNDGASIAVMVGAGEAGPNYAGLLERYLDPSRQLPAGGSLSANPDKVAKVYDQELAAWLGERFGFSGDNQAARAFFAALPAEQQRIFARQVYFAELREGGREYNDASSPRSGSYLRGRQVIAALFPERDVAGNPISYSGNATFYGGAGIHTDFGGNIQVLTPGGQQVFGVEGEAPPASAGVITQGSGDIQLYSRGSILLGQSRIMTTFGGAILGWSAEGDINAGRGSKTTVVYTPPKRTYDQWGNVGLAPSVPSTGAGIATLNPIPEVAPGDIDLIAPLGTIDAGEAGIRVSGNVNIAALRVVNAANIQVQGNANGMPVVASVNTGAITAASAAASSASQAAEEAGRQRQQGARRQPSLITVQVLGFGDERLVPGREGASLNPQYNRQSPVQVLGAGVLDEQARGQLTEEERGNLVL
ncbi:filamentous haemagglutinin family protein [Pseudomonas xanthosomatis]|uniref:filamentous haemagglutinin family protein n=1 Tax=Pseudomonas xanthosomatis TaxID=2842356 RepID=UPI0035199706